MAYNPADLRLPLWLIHLLDQLVAITLPLGWRWRIGLTRPGAMLLFSILGVWAAAFYSANNLLYLCGAMLLLIALGGMVQGVNMLRSMPALSPYIPPYIEAKTPWIVHQETVADKKNIGLTTICIAHAPDGSLLQLQWWCNGTKAWLRGRISSMQRGVIAIDELNYCSSAPIGLWNMHKQYPVALHIAVLPPPMPWPQAYEQGEHSDQRQAQEGDDFYDLRGYVAGDAPSRIHWRKAGANVEDWRVKRFAQYDAPHQAATLIVDLRMPAHADATAFEHLLGMAWAWFKHHQEDHLAIQEIVIGQSHYPCQTPAEQQACRMALATAVPENTAPLQQSGLYLSLCKTS
ncbi:MAG: DUF58 domain-containing protein [Mariprofundaceae bacterium]|nr:DUF58 domain-containing protein [Mariprofundaceae bacterium]